MERLRYYSSIQSAVLSHELASTGDRLLNDAGTPPLLCVPRNLWPLLATDARILVGNSPLHFTGMYF